MSHPWWREKRWGIALLLLLVTAVGSIDRQATSVTAALIKADFQLTNTEYGALAFAFLLAYGIGQLLAGAFVDRFGTKRALSLAVIWWSIAAISHAFARGFWGFFAARAFLGVTEGANFPAAYKAIAEWFPRAERSMASGLVIAGTGLGLIVAPPLAGVLAYYFGWQAAFIVPGLAGLVWVWFWNRRYFLPEEHPTISARERALALADRVPGAAAPLDWGGRMRLWRYYLGYRETWGLVLGRFIGDCAFYFFSVWLPLYMQTERGFSILSAAWVVAIPFVFSDLGSLFGGWSGQRLIRNGWSVDRSRKTMIWAGCLGVLVAWPVNIVADPWFALLLASLAIFSIQVKTASMFPLAVDLFPARDVATVWGMSGAAGAAGAALFQWGFGWLIDAYGYNPVFAIVSLLCILQAIVITALIPRVQPIALRAVPAAGQS
jgi:ACS family hexuronate transporter-like MFS transporter